MHLKSEIRAVLVLESAWPNGLHARDPGFDSRFRLKFFLKYCGLLGITSIKYISSPLLY